MFWFKFRQEYEGSFESLFQYIICFGSRKLCKELGIIVIYFNTSYVLVQATQARYKSKLIAYFNTSYVLVQVWYCFVSCGKLGHFNTSYVLVQDSHEFEQQCGWAISIHHMFWFKAITYKQLNRYDDFNTSYVLVQGMKPIFKVVANKFQYIICFGSSSKLWFKRR